MLFSIFIGFLTMPYMSSGLRRDLYFYDRACQIGLLVTLLAAVIVFCIQRFQVRLMFFLELIIALSIVGSHYVVYNESRGHMLKLQQRMQEIQREQAEQSQP